MNKNYNMTKRLRKKKRNHYYWLKSCSQKPASPFWKN